MFAPFLFRSVYFLGRQRNCSDFFMSLCQFVDQTGQSKIKDVDVVSHTKETANNTQVSVLKCTYDTYY